jgi:DNA-binding beta-propeller fold protein YncE
VKSSRMILCFFLVAISVAGLAQQYKITNRISFPGESGWDYLFADSAARILYVTHSDRVEVIDLDSQKAIAGITGLNRVHGVAVAADLNRGFISDGGANVVVVFDTKSRAELQRVKAGSNPDGIIYDAPSKRVFAFNGSSQDATVIDASTGNIAGSIPMGGKPEFPVSDGKGNVFVNVEDKSEILKIDPKAMRVLQHWSVAPCEEPSGLAMDTAHNRLFSVCSNQKMVVVDADSGKVVATVPIGKGPDAVVFDDEKHVAYSSNGQDGTITVIKQESADKYSVVETVATEKSARTVALDNKTHNLYLSAAQLGAAPAATADNPHPRPKIVAGSFKVLVVSTQ